MLSKLDGRAWRWLSPAAADGFEPVFSRSWGPDAPSRPGRAAGSCPRWESSKANLIWTRVCSHQYHQLVQAEHSVYPVKYRDTWYLCPLGNPDIAMELNPRQTIGLTGYTEHRSLTRSGQGCGCSPANSSRVRPLRWAARAFARLAIPASSSSLDLLLMDSRMLNNSGTETSTSGLQQQYQQPSLQSRGGLYSSFTTSIASSAQRAVWSATSSTV